MTKEKILSYVDHTLLKATSSWEEIIKLCEESIKYNTASICIPPDYVSRVKDKYAAKVNVCTVIGFPLGYQTTTVKVFEAKEALKNGASEIDVVINIGDVKNNNFEKILQELKVLKEIAGENILKIIIETCYLNEEEKIKLCKIVTESRADYIKTSTGFGTAGATLEDIKLFRLHIGKNVKIKAAGGIRSVKDMEDFITAGATRLGTSSAISILEGENSKEY